MTTAASLIQQAFREGNLIPTGKSPTADEQAEGLQLLNRLLRAAFGYMMGENLASWPVPHVQRTGPVDANPPLAPGAGSPRIISDNAYPAKNTRIVWDGSTQTVYFPSKPDDGTRMALVKSSGAVAADVGSITLSGNGRTIEGADTYVDDGTVLTRQWFYRADLADWRALVDLSVSDDCPFPPELDDAWICGLAVRLSPRYGKTLAGGTIETYKSTWQTFRTRYQQSAPGTAGGLQLINGVQSYDTGNGWMEL